MDINDIVLFLIIFVTVCATSYVIYANSIFRNNQEVGPCDKSVDDLHKMNVQLQAYIADLKEINSNNMSNMAKLVEENKKCASTLTEPFVVDSTYGSVDRCYFEKTEPVCACNDAKNACFTLANRCFAITNGLRIKNTGSCHDASAIEVRPLTTTFNEGTVEEEEVEEEDAAYKVCDSGQFLHRFTTCKNCPMSYPISVKGTTSMYECTKCAPGEKPKPDMSGCDLCPIDTYSGYGRECIRCPVDKTTFGMKGASVCKSKVNILPSIEKEKKGCAHNEIKIGRNCVKCPENTPFLSEDKKRCIGCPKGEVVVNSLCTPCPLNTVQVENKCVDCPHGQVTRTVGSTMCESFEDVYPDRYL